MTHQSVLLQESINGLAIKADGIYIDGTFGRGGHSQAILGELSSRGKLIAVDKDPDAIAYANAHFSSDNRFQIIHDSFANLEQITKSLNNHGKIDGILLDLGVSSPQLDNAERGFSFMQKGTLDMRMDSTQALSANEFINQASPEEMKKIFREYGEERFSGRIATAIVNAREQAPITTTTELAEVIKQANPKWEKHKHPATRVFQAIRIHINQELDDLKTGLEAAYSALNVGGRLVVISFHSLEDRIVKQFMRSKEKGHMPPMNIPIRAIDMKTNFKCIGKAVKPQEIELKENNRARSAVLRIGEKIA